MGWHAWIRLIELAAIGLFAGLIAVELARANVEDYGWPWALRPGGNGRRPADLMVMAFFGTLAIVCAVFVVLALLGVSLRPFTTVLLGVLAATLGGVYVVAHRERRRR